MDGGPTQAQRPSLREEKWRDMADEGAASTRAELEEPGAAMLMDLVGNYEDTPPSPGAGST